MALGLSPGPARFLPPAAGHAFAGAGGAALVQAALEHRAQQRHAAGHMHPPSHPLALEALTGGVQAPGSGLLQALGQ